jgi:hypothetical protein
VSGAPGSIRRHRATTSGRTLRFPSRLITDDHRRAFSERVVRRGGVVVVDQSGSMDLDEESLRTLLRRTPYALVLGYSHRPGDRGSSPNAWVLCDRGNIATAWPRGNVGNGVDGPVLEWALQRRRANEPFVWVTDGQVTDSHDHPDERLTNECVHLIRRHRIRLARDLVEATALLQTNRPNPQSSLAGFGRVGRTLSESLEM